MRQCLKLPKSLCFFRLLFIYIFILSAVFTCPALAEQWWSTSKIEDTRQVDKGFTYERVLYQKITNEPVRAHILNVTGVGVQYIFGVLGSYGALFPASGFSKQSDAVAIVNGSFFSKKPTRALGLVAAHNRILYPPHAGENIRGAVGFAPRKILFDWISKDDIEGNRFKSAKPDWNNCHAALGAGPLLIKDGTPLLSTPMEGYNLEQTAPRTAIGQTKDGMVYLIVVDGRQPAWSAGITLSELGELFISRKAHNALNLDGGGSSTMIIQNEIINRPSDYAIPGQPGKERPVANVISIFKK
jgi:exopolysaccharide biosynthesis protein